jgi:hypothetical protein
MPCFETRLSSCWRITVSEPLVNRRASCAATSLPCAIRCWPRSAGNGNARSPTPWWISSIAHRIGVKAEEKVDATLLQYVKKIVGKTRLLYKLKAAKGQPDGVVKEVIYPAVGEKTLDDLIREADADEEYGRQVRLVTRASYSHYYRRVVPALLEALAFRCNNERHRPVMQALALLERYRDRKTTRFPLQEEVPLKGVVKDDWHDLVLDEQTGGHVNRISYELCAWHAAREGALQRGVGRRRGALL